MVDLSEAERVVGVFLKEARDAGTITQHFCVFISYRFRRPENRIVVCRLKMT
jgi:hypothetical protein